MRRRLVLSSETRRHAFRATLPPHVFRIEEAPARKDDKDVKLFLLSFAAFFVCFYAFIL